VTRSAITCGDRLDCAVLARRKACMRIRPASFTAAAPFELPGDPQGKSARGECQDEQHRANGYQLGGEGIFSGPGARFTAAALQANAGLAGRAALWFQVGTTAAGTMRVLPTVRCPVVQFSSCPRPSSSYAQRMRSPLVRRPLVMPWLCLCSDGSTAKAFQKILLAAPACQ
jgi:hypothetical protein